MSNQRNKELSFYWIKAFFNLLFQVGETRRTTVNSHSFTYFQVFFRRQTVLSIKPPDAAILSTVFEYSPPWLQCTSYACAYERRRCRSSCSFNCSGPDGSGWKRSTIAIVWCLRNGMWRLMCSRRESIDLTHLYHKSCSSESHLGLPYTAAAQTHFKTAFLCSYPFSTLAITPFNPQYIFSQEQ